MRPSLGPLPSATSSCGGYSVPKAPLPSASAEGEKMMILEAWSSDTGWIGDFQSIGSEVRLAGGFTCNKRVW